MSKPAGVSPATWFGWENLAGGSIYSPPAVASWGSGRLDVFATNATSNIIHRWYDNGWSGWESLGGFSFLEGDCCDSAPAAVSWGPGRIDVFVRGADSKLYHRWYSGGWSNWEDLGGPIWSAPAVSSWASGRLDVFATDINGSIIHKWFNGSWSGWESLGGFSFLEGDCCDSAPAAVSWGPGRIDVFVRGADSKLYHRWYSGGWSNWEDLGGPIWSAPAVSSWASGRLDVFATDINGSAIHKWFNGSWSGWESLGGISFRKAACCDSAPAAVSWGPERIDVLVRGADNDLYHRWWR